MCTQLIGSGAERGRNRGGEHEDVELVTGPSFTALLWLCARTAELLWAKLSAELLSQGDQQGSRARATEMMRPHLQRLTRASLEQMQSELVEGVLPSST